MATRREFLMPACADVSEARRLETKAVLEDGTFEGYASLFDREDMGRDVVVRGAFNDSLRAKGAGGIKMLFQHDPAEPIGIWEEIREDANGLYVRGRLMTAVAKAREVLALMRAGALDGLSIGFKAQRTQRDGRSGVRRILKIDLWEISVVTFPMLPQARVAAVKMSALRAQQTFADHDIAMAARLRTIAARLCARNAVEQTHAPKGGRAGSDRRERGGMRV